AAPPRAARLAHRHTAHATAAGRQEGAASCRRGRQARRSSLDDATKASERVCEHSRPSRRQPVGATAIISVERVDQAALLEPADRAVERARAEPYAGERVDVEEEGVSVLGAGREAREDEQAGIVHALHATTRYVVVQAWRLRRVRRVG